MAPAIAIALGALQLSGGGWIACRAGCRETETCQPARALTRTTPDEAKPFLGEWTSVVVGPAGPIDVIIEIKVDEGKVVATVSTDVMGDNEVEDITTTEKGITLHYTVEFWGYSGPMVLRLASRGQHLQADFSLMDGWFAFGGVATKRQRIPRERLRAGRSHDQPAQSEVFHIAGLH